MQARRSRPGRARRRVARAAASRRRASRILTSMVRMRCRSGASSVLSAARLAALRDVRDQPPRERELGRARQRVRAGVVEQRDLVVVRADRVLREIGDEQRQLLARRLASAYSAQVLALGGEADAERRPAAARRRRRGCPGSARARACMRRCRFLILCARGLAGVVVGDRGDADEDVGAPRTRVFTASNISRAVVTSTRCTPAGGGERWSGPETSVTSAPASTRGLRDARSPSCRSCGW